MDRQGGQGRREDPQLFGICRWMGLRDFELELFGTTRRILQFESFLGSLVDEEDVDGGNEPVC